MRTDTGKKNHTQESRSICKKYKARGSLLPKASNWSRGIKRTPNNKKNLFASFVTRTEAFQ